MRGEILFVTLISVHSFLSLSFVVIPPSKTPFNLNLTGITNDDVDLSVDALKAVTLPLLKQFGVGEEGGLDLKVGLIPEHSIGVDVN